MKLSFQETPDSLLVTLTGQLDENSASGLPVRLNSICKGKNQNSIVIDLSGCKVESCLGYGALVAFRLSPDALNKHVTLQNAVPDVLNGMKALRFEKLFKLA